MCVKHEILLILFNYSFRIIKNRAMVFLQPSSFHISILIANTGFFLLQLIMHITCRCLVQEDKFRLPPGHFSFMYGSPVILHVLDKAPALLIQRSRIILGVGLNQFVCDIMQVLMLFLHLLEPDPEKILDGANG